MLFARSFVIAALLTPTFSSINAQDAVQNYEVLARFGEKALENGAKEFFAYSKKDLKQAALWIGQSTNSVPLAFIEKQGELFVYSTKSYLKTDADLKIRITGNLGNGQCVEDTLSYNANGDGVTFLLGTSAVVTCPAPVVVEAPITPSLSPTTSYEAQANVSAPRAQAQSNVGQLDVQTIMYGASWIDPNTLARARAQYMADRGMHGHLGSGSVMTNMGRLSEGTGWSSGGGTPPTCTATNGTAAVGDGIVAGSNGNYRVRLYNSPGTTSGGSGRRR